MGLKPIYEMFAGYNAWANARVYDAAARVGDADYRADKGAFFGSLCGTLNHLVVADRIWLRRFTREGPQPASLDETVHEDLASLRAAREAEDERIQRYVESLSEQDLAGDLRYRTLLRPEEVVQPLWAVLGHFFNHQTHHRGQVHGLLTAIGGRDAAPPLDLLIFQRERAAS
jgi:uncharacterized damage-inducible protein DinB